jgi:hypothetical protein
VALIAFGAVVVAADTATASSKTTPSGSTLQPNQGVLIFGLVLVGLGVLSLAVLAFTAFMRWREDRVAPLELFHRPDSDKECEELFTIPPSDFDGQQLRVGVRNKGSAGVQHVRVFMRILEGEGRSYFLHLQHDNDPARSASRNGEFMAVGQRTYFDVALVKRTVQHVVGTRPGNFFFVYADTQISDMSGVGIGFHSWLIRLEVTGWTTGRDVIPTTKDFRLTMTSQGQLAMTEVP